MALIEIFPSPADMTRAAANLFAARAAEAVSARGRFTAALSGGKTPVAIYDLLAKDPLACRRSPGRAFISSGGMSAACPPITGTATTGSSASDSSIMCPSRRQTSTGCRERWTPWRPRPGTKSNCGNSSHRTGMAFPFSTSSFWVSARTATRPRSSPGPGRSANRRGGLLGHYVDAQKGWRITLTPPVINAARMVVFIVSGAGKAAVLKEILEGPFRPDTLPAQIVRPADGTLLWMLDREAAALLKGKGKGKT